MEGASEPETRIVDEIDVRYRDGSCQEEAGFGSGGCFTLLYLILVAKVRGKKKAHDRSVNLHSDTTDIIITIILI